MSLSHSIFKLPPDQQDEAIRVIARKAIRDGQPSRRLFDRWMLEILHAKHAAGASNEDIRVLRKHYRRLYAEAHGR